MSHSKHRLSQWVDRLVHEVRDIIREVIRWAVLPTNPSGTFSFALEQRMSNHFRVTVGCPPLADAEVGEVLQRRFKVVKLNTDGSEGEELKNVVIDMQGAGALSPQFEAMQDDHCRVSMWNIDDAGNQSSESLTTDFQIRDTVPPDAPSGSFVFNLEELPGTSPAAPSTTPPVE